MPKAMIVINPIRVPPARLRPVVRACESKAGWDESIWIETTAHDAGQSAATAALRHEPDVVIVAGGDGTVRAVASVLRGTSVPMTLVPTGTGNLLARNLRLPLTDLDACVAAAFEGTDRLIDMVAARLTYASGDQSEHVFLAMAGIGLDAAMADKSDVRLKKLLGWMAYVPPIAQSVLSNRSFELRARIDDRAPRSGPAHTMIIGNCGVLTGDIVLMPAAVVDDHRLDVVILRPGRLVGWVPIALRLVANGVVYRRGRRRQARPRGLPSSRTAVHRQGRRFEAEFDQPQLIQIDGDVVDHVTAASFELLPSALMIRTSELSDRPALPR